MKGLNLRRGLASIFCLLAAVAVGVTVYTTEAENDINQLLETKSYEIVSTDGEEPITYYSKKTNSIDEHMRNKLDIIEQTANEGIVLVKNNGLLPLGNKASKITLLGYASANLVYGGRSGNAQIGNVGIDAINIPFKIALEDAGYSINPSMWNFYKANNNSESPVEDLPTDDIAEYDDAVIVVVARNLGEGADGVLGYYDLTAIELALVAKAKEISQNVIVVNNSPSPLSCDEFDKDDGVDAIIVAGCLGATGANSLANIIKGTVNPSGKLPDTYAVDSMSSPAYQTAGTTAYVNTAAIEAASPLGAQEKNNKYTIQNEGIYIGYKYYETRYEDTVLNQGNAKSTKGAFASQNNWNYASEVTYPFGYGLSYSTFTQEITSFKAERDIVTMHVKVSNTSNVAGKDVVQLYVQTPYTQYDKTNKVEKAAIQLLGFAKTDTLAPNASEVVTIVADFYNFASYDYTKAKTWILDDGDYYFAIGNGAHEALNNVLTEKGYNTTNGLTANGNRNLVKKWTNNQFRNLKNYEFADDGFMTINGLNHMPFAKEITNQLETGDLNTYIDNSTVYMTRNNWDASWPQGIADVTATSAMIEALTFDYTPGEAVSTDPSLKYGQDTTYDISALIGLDFNHELWDIILEQMTVEEMVYTVGKNFGAIDPILGINFPGTADNDGVGSGPAKNYLAKYNTGSTIFEGISDYGSVGAQMYAGETVLASTFNQKLVYQIGENQSEDCYYTGLNTLWGPGLNIHRTPYSGRNFEYFSEDSMLTYIMGAQVSAGVQSNGVVSCPKHFVFNDQETDRYGYGVWQNEQSAREIYLRGFEGAISVGRAMNVMTGLNRVGCEWAGACAAIQQAILKDEWGFLGYCITDNAVMPFMYGRSVVFGNDKMMLLPGNNRNAELNKTAVLADKTLFLALRDSCHRILYTYVNSNAMNGTYANMTIRYVMPWWKGTLIGTDVVFSVIALGFIGFYLLGVFKKKGA